MATPRAGTTRPTPHPDAPPPGTDLPRHYSGCFGCGELEGGLRLRFRTGPDLTVTGTFAVDTHHQGAPGLAHGGVITAAFDEALGALQVYFREPAVTASLRTDFLRPVPVGSVLHIRTRVDGREGRKLRVSGEGRLDAPDGPLAARASALFVVVDHQHFVRHGRPAEVEAGAEVDVNP
ncbi:MAG TPA: PaaI family thioesterase [Pseudonocardia sp.]|nr:PaaI family thioesterase [Pseudonocardia sp.]